MFKKFGYILTCKVAKSDDGKSLGHGFVQFESEESANAAIQKMNGVTVGDKQMYVLFLFLDFFASIVVVCIGNFYSKDLKHVYLI